MIPTVDFLGAKVSRLIVGDNPINGHSYIPSVAKGEEMIDYYTEENVMLMMKNAESLGYNGYLPLGNDFMMRAIRHYRLSGGKMNVIFQSYPPVDFAVNIRQMAQCAPLGIYHQGTTTDGMCEEGRFLELRDRIKMIKDAGIHAGLGTHVPETIMRAEDEDWGVDFYAACLHNSRKRGPEESSFITGKEKTIKFFMEDRPLMLDTIAKVNKPVVAYKLFAGGQVFLDKRPEAYPEIIEEVFRETFSAIKPGDIAAIGVFQRDHDQLQLSAAAMQRISQK